MHVFQLLERSKSGLSKSTTTFSHYFDIIFFLLFYTVFRKVNKHSLQGCRNKKNTDTLARENQYLIVYSDQNSQ